MQPLGREGKRIRAGKGDIFGQQAAGMDSPYPPKAGRLFAQAGKKNPAVLQKTIEKSLESS
jgi:hypothetical protein